MDPAFSKALKACGALSDPSRLRLLFAVRRGERCVCELIELLGLAPATVSKHLSILRAAGWLASRKQGRWVHYRLAAPLPFPFLGRQAAPLFRTLENSRQVRADDRSLDRIVASNSLPPCRRISRNPHKEAR